MNLRRNLSALTSLLMCAIGVAALGISPVRADGLLDGLRPAHPRLMLTDDDVEALHRQAENDVDLQRYVEDVLGQAEAEFALAPIEYRKRGIRLLQVSREALRRIYLQAFAWRWTGDEKHAQRVREHLLTVCAFEDWNPSHFLDTAEMSHAVAIGFDWTFDYLDEASREQVRSGLIRLGLQPGIDKLESRAWYFTTAENNWNMVCYGGMIVGCLAVADTDPQYAETFLPAAKQNMPLAMNYYAPDGAWMEGPAYWHYATRYVCYAISALETSLGNDFGLAQFDGLDHAGYFPLETAGPTGRYFNFADDGHSRRSELPCLFYMARRFDQPLLAAAEHQTLESGAARPQHLMWYAPRPEEPYLHATARVFQGRTPVVVFRPQGEDNDGLFVAIKGGFNQANHGHLDLGSFVLDALGERFVIDLGKDNYDMPGYFDRRDGGRRWTYYRNQSRSHSVPLIGGQGQSPLGETELIRTDTVGEEPFALFDLTKAYNCPADRIWRGVRVGDNGRSIVLRDEFDLAEPTEIVWGITTPAEITIEDGRTAWLQIGESRLAVHIVAPENASFSTSPCEEPGEPQASNEGFYRLTIHLGTHANTDVTVRFVPDWPEATVLPASEIRPLADW